LSTINVKELAEMKSQAKPPSGGVEDAFAACLALMGEPPRKRDWASIQKLLSNPSQLIADLKAIKVGDQTRDPKHQQMSFTHQIARKIDSRIRCMTSN